MQYVGGFFGMEQNDFNVLVIDHQYGNVTNWAPIAAISHLYGTDSYVSLSTVTLSQFTVILGLPNSNDPNYSADIAAVESYLTAGGTVIVYTDAGAPTSITGIGSTAVQIPYPHPILQPYPQAALTTAFGGTLYGYINAYGAGQVITLKTYGYGDGFGVCDSSGNANTSDGLSSGLAYITLNAILWAAGKATPAIYLPSYVKRTSWAVPLNTNGEGGTPYALIAICGTPGSPSSLLVWLSNSNASATETIQICLSQTFFGTPAHWQAYNKNGSSVAANGSGDIVLDVTVPIQDWAPLYIQSSSGSSTQLIIVE
jgi:hypothetical protein